MVDYDWQLEVDYIDYFWQRRLANDGASQSQADYAPIRWQLIFSSLASAMDASDGFIFLRDGGTLDKVVKEIDEE